MHLTNKLNLPEPFVQAVQRLNPPRNPESGKISITTLIRPPQLVALERQHWEEIEEDVSDRVWALWGTMGHLVLQASGDHDTEGEVTTVVDRLEVVGHYDLLVKGVLWDWKNTSAWAVKDGVKFEWEAQMNLYRLLLTESGKEVEALKIGCILRDWSRTKARDSADYPKQPVVVMDVDLWPMERAREFLEQAVKDHTASTPRPCTAEERWYSGSTWAVKKKGRKTALRVLPTAEMAEAWQKANGGDSIEHRPGEFRRCAGYCPVSEFCPVWQKERHGQHAA